MIDKRREVALMDQDSRDLLIRILRESTADGMAAAEALTPFLRDNGGEREEYLLAALTQSLYRNLRAVIHLELTRGDLFFCPRPTDLGDLVQKVGEQVDYFAELLGVEFRWDVDQGNYDSVADPDLLELALLNLLSNALRSARLGGGKVALRARRQGDAVVVTVADNGPGLYHRGDSDPVKELLSSPMGLGLGLEGVRTVAQLHKGVLVLEDREDQGVRAVLRLPILTGDDVVASPQADYLPAGGYSPALVEFSELLPREAYRMDDVE